MATYWAAKDTIKKALLNFSFDSSFLDLNESVIRQSLVFLNLFSPAV